MYEEITFAFSLVAALGILFSSIVAFFRPEYRLWPPPNKKSWQKILFISLFRAMLYSLLLLTYLQIKTSFPVFTIFQLIGFFLVCAGFGLAFMSTYGLGWAKAFGEKGGLETSGFFSFSRNPIYVVSWVGMIGWALLASSWHISLILFIWALFYVLAVFLEERWLEKVYGEEYLLYKSKTSRFIG